MVPFTLKSATASLAAYTRLALPGGRSATAATGVKPSVRLGRRARLDDEALLVRLIGRSGGGELVDRPPRHRQIAVGNREIAAEIGAVERGLELDQRVEVFRHLPQQEVRVAANADETVGPEQE